MFDQTQEATFVTQLGTLLDNLGSDPSDTPFRWQESDRGEWGCEVCLSLQFPIQVVDDHGTKTISRDVSLVLRVWSTFSDRSPEIRVSEERLTPECFRSNPDWWRSFPPQTIDGVAPWLSQILAELKHKESGLMLSRASGRRIRLGSPEIIGGVSEPKRIAVGRTSESRLTETRAKAGTAPPRPRIRLGRITPPYRPTTLGVPSWLNLMAGRTDVVESRHWLLLLPKATAQLLEHIGWGEERSDNRVEQGGILFGQVYRDEERRTTYALVEEISPAFSARGSSSHLEFGPEVWKEMLDVADQREERTGYESQVIGWYHTHPGPLSVFMSGTDQATQQLFFPDDWQFSLVLNPQKEVFKAFHGKDSTRCNVGLRTSDDWNEEAWLRDFSKPQAPTPSVETSDSDTSREAPVPGSGDSHAVGWRELRRAVGLAVTTALALSRRYRWLPAVVVLGLVMMVSVRIWAPERPPDPADKPSESSDADSHRSGARSPEPPVDPITNAETETASQAAQETLKDEESHKKPTERPTVEQGPDGEAGQVLNTAPNVPPESSASVELQWVVRGEPLLIRLEGDAEVDKLGEAGEDGWYPVQVTFDGLAKSAPVGEP